MPLGNSGLTAIVLAPMCTFLSAISLVLIQRATDFVKLVATTPQRGFYRQIKPFMKSLNTLIERTMGEEPFKINSTTILLMTIAVLLLVGLLEGAEREHSRQKEKKKKNQ